MKARDVFQKDLEEELKTDIKHFESKKDLLSGHINSLLKSISKIRNHFKINKFDDLNEIEKKAITKLSIEQLINIRNYISMKQEN